MAETPQLSGIHAGVCPPLTAPDKGSVRGGGGQVPPGLPTCPGSALVSARPDGNPGRLWLPWPHHTVPVCLPATRDGEEAT